MKRKFIVLSLGLFLIAHFSYPLQKEKGSLNLLLITIDTLRPDRLSCYSSQHVQTPNIDGLAEKGVLFARAFAHTTTTLASHTNILLGLTPPYHGIHGNSTFIVRKEFLTLAGHLKSFGYSTGAFVGGYPLSSRFGLTQGFDIYDDDFAGQDFKKPPVLGRKAEVVINRALSWLGTRESPWFLWVHCFDPHDPYMPSAPFSVQYKKQPYDGEVAYVDFTLGKLFSYMNENKLFDKTLVIFTGDHGESLGQHSELTHGYLAYNTTLWIPLIIVYPGANQGKVEQNVSHIDIFPTACDILHLPKPSLLQGISLLPALKGKNLPQRPIYFESLDPYYSKGWAPLYGFIDGGEKFIESPIPELYDLEKDFDELTNLVEKKGLDGYRKRLEQMVKDLSSPAGTKAEEKIDLETLEKLKSLGYVGSLSSPESRKKTFGPEDDVKVLLPYYKKAIEAMDLYQNGRAHEGIELLNGIIDQRKDFYLAYYDLGIVYRETGKLKDALAVLKLGLERLPSNYEIFHNYVSCLLDATQYDEVIKLISQKKLRAMEFDPGIWLNLGVAYSNKGNLENAELAYEKALSLDKKNPIIYNNLGWDYYYLTLKTKDQRTFQKCVESFKKALELDPRYASSYNGLGEAYRLADNLDGAIYCWEKAVQLKPDFDETLYSLGLAYFDKGETAKALVYFTKYKERCFHLLTPGEKKELDELIQKCKAKS